MDSAAPLFAGWKETMIWTCLQGHMGTVVTDGRTPPESALCAVGDFCFLAGKPDPELARREFRKVLCGDLVCVYKVIGQSVFVYRVVNGRTDYPQLLK